MTLLHRGYRVVIGIEVHVQLKTKTKLFCSCPSKFGQRANTNICHVCTGQLGTLPVLNKKAVDLALRVGLATGCTISRFSEFARKHYCYPDLPKNYQITQADRPICQFGRIFVLDDEGKSKPIRIRRIHMEEDAGKSVHMGDFSLVDFNRAGTPLIEIVSDPDVSSIKEAIQYLEKLREIVQYVDASDANMEEGSFRADVNVSVMRPDAKEFGTRTELKNINSFKFIEQAIAYELDRQIDLLEEGKKVTQSTRGYDSKTRETTFMRSKEDSQDYRYLAEPDLPTLMIDAAWIEKVKAELPELPEEKRDRFSKVYGLSAYESEILTASRKLADFFEETAKKSKLPKQAANWILRDLLGFLNETGEDLDSILIKSDTLAELLVEIERGTVSSSMAREVFLVMAKTGKYPSIIINELGLVQVSDAEAVNKFIDELAAKFPSQYKTFIEGDPKLLGFLVGQTVKISGGKVNPKAVSDGLLARRS